MCLFKEFAGVDAFPICINSKDSREIVETVKRIATAFGGINLEDIAHRAASKSRNGCKVTSIFRCSMTINMAPPS